MAKPRRTRIGIALIHGFARLADPAPESIVLFMEDSDWAMVGQDLRDAMAVVDDQLTQQTADDEEHDDQLVEA